MNFSRKMSLKAENISYNNLENICRTCLLNCELISIHQNIKILEILRNIIGVDFEINDDLPQQICFNCFEKLSEIHEYSAKVKQAQSYFKQVINERKESDEQLKMKEEITIEEHKIEFDSDEDETTNKFEEVLLTPNSNIKFENEDVNIAEDIINTQNEKTPKKRHKMYTCEICNKILTHLKTYNKHMREHSGERPYKCEICPMSYIDPFWLKRHQLSHNSDHLLKCEICDRMFTEPSSLTKHKAVHSDVRPFECDVCEKTFKFPHNLLGHKKTHKGERPYECDVCPKAFTSSWNLLRHKRVHSGERPYKCDVCDKGFVEPNKLRKHFRTHHE